MESGIFEPEKDFGKAQFQQELNRWFESRGIITDLRSHLRHLMVTALQSTHLGTKPTDGSSPKAQALNLIVAEYLFRHSCHYTLSVFTSEVPTLANFNPGEAPRGGRRSDPEKKLSGGVCFRDNEIEEIFNALGMSSRGEELTHLKASYLEKGGETSLLELFLRGVVNMSTKLQIRENLQSLAAEEGERLLSRKWSTKIADLLLAERMTPPQIAAVEEEIFRITEAEVRRILEEERRVEVEKLARRERRIQEYLRKHEDEIFMRLVEAEKVLATRKGVIEEELTERQKHLTKMALEWNNKHEEIVRLSKSFHNIENENRRLQRRVRELEEENGKLRTREESQTRTTDELREEVKSLKSKLKEVTDSNAVLTERIQVLISRENVEASVRHDGQETTGRGSGEEIPLLWSRNTALEDSAPSNRAPREESRPGTKPKEPPVKMGVSPPERCDAAEPTGTRFRWNGAESNRRETDANSSGDEEDVSLSPSSEEIIIGVRKKLQELEAETDRINQNYLEYKLKCISIDSSSEGSSSKSDESSNVKTPPNVSEKPVMTETKFCQTVTEGTFAKIQKLEEKKEDSDFEYALAKKSEEASPKMPAVRTPTKRQMQNREFFLKSRKLLRELERQNLEDLQATSPSIAESPSFSSGGEDFTRSFGRENKKSPARSVLLTPLRTASFYCNDEPGVEKPADDSGRNKSADTPDKSPKDDLARLALLEEARIKSPQTSARKPLRQQILLSESEKDAEDEKISNCQKSSVSSPVSPPSGKLSVAKKSGNESFW